jgi:hypothetical protein
VQYTGAAVAAITHPLRERDRDEGQVTRGVSAAASPPKMRRSPGIQRG